MEFEAPNSSDFLGDGEKILIVDDESAIRDVSSRVLKRLNFQPITAADGADAIVQAAENRKDLRVIITDMHMPHMDGLALVRGIRRVLPAVPVIVASGRLDDHERRELTKLNVSGFLHKPFTQEDMGTLLRDVLHSDSEKIRR